MDRGKALGYGNSPIFLNDETTFKYHKQNNLEIKEILENFMSVNNLDYKDFVVCGSACASYMDYFILNNVRDVDVYITNSSKSDIIRTDKIDSLKFISIFSDLNNFETKDNFQFLTKMDMLISTTIGGLRKRKERDLWYSGLLLTELDMSVDDLAELLTEGVPILTHFTDEEKESILKLLPFMKVYLTHRIDDITNYNKENFTST